ncbi:MAG: hypothetical protein WAN47_03850 [Nitrosotalea sp.]
MSNSDKVSVDEMLNALEHYGVKREMLEKLHPSPETIAHLYSSIKKTKFHLLLHLWLL